MIFGRVRSRAWTLIVAAGVATVCVAVFVLVRWMAHPVPPQTDGPTAAKTDAPLDSLPRLERIWSREGLGRFDGAARAGIYYTVENEGRFMHAVDAASGKTVWQRALPEPVGVWVRIRVVGDAILLAYPRGGANAAVARLSAGDGSVSWSEVIACPGVDSRSAGPRFYLLCEGQVGSWNTETRQLDLATGKELSRVRIEGRFDFASGGEVCGISDTTTWCGRIAGDRLDVLWTQPGEGVRFELAGDSVIRSGTQTVVRRTTDGRVLWQRPGRPWIFAHEPSGRLFLWGDDAMDVVRLSDGAPLATFPVAGQLGARFLSDDALVLVDPHEPGGGRVHLVDAQSRVRSLTRNATFLDEVVGGVMLSRNVGMYGVNRDRAPLDAYSLSQFALPQDRLDPYHQVIAVLERFPFSSHARGALAALRSIPDAMAVLETVIRSGPAQVRTAAIAVAGVTGDPRFVAPLRERLDAIGVPPARARDWAPITDIVDALSSLRSPEAPAALLAFWARVGATLPPALSGVQRYLRDAVASSIWTYGARKDWVPCEDIVFPVVHSPPDRATLGTHSPGVEYAVDVQRRWAAICEARTDDDGNGKLEVVTHMHGDTGGDRLRPYLVLGSGPGTEIDDFVAAAPDGRWLVVTKNMCVHLVDARSGKAVALRGADGRPGDPIVGSHRAASFSPDGTALLYIRSDGARASVIQRDLRSGVERILDPGPGELSGAFFESSGRFAVMDVIVLDTDHDGVLQWPRGASTLSRRRCRGPAISASFYGQVGDKPVQRIAAVTGDATVKDAPRGTTFEPAEPAMAPYELAPPIPEEPGINTRLPLGPLHWQVLRNR